MVMWELSVLPGHPKYVETFPCVRCFVSGLGPFIWREAQGSGLMVWG